MIQLEYTRQNERGYPGRCGRYCSVRRPMSWRTPIVVEEIDIRVSWLGCVGSISYSHDDLTLQ
jgi:hypothetical protein